MNNKNIKVKPNENYYEGRGNLKLETESLRVFEPTMKEKKEYLKDGYEIEYGEGKNKTKITLTGFNEIKGKDDKTILLFKLIDYTIKYYVVTEQGEEIITKMVNDMREVFPFIEAMNMREQLPNVVEALRFDEKSKKIKEKQN